MDKIDKIKINMTLQEIGLKHNTDKAYAHHYCDFYQENLPDRESKIRILEIGVKDGASLRMWREYYPNAEVVGIDINKSIKIEGCTVLQMDQCDQYALSLLGNFDIIIDDGSHMTLHQQLSFLQLFYNNLNEKGIYIMEDVHTSFYPDYINSKINTYDFLAVISHLKIKEWCRIPDKLDSLTMLIYK